NCTETACDQNKLICIEWSVHSITTKSNQLNQFIGFDCTRDVIWTTAETDVTRSVAWSAGTDLSGFEVTMTVDSDSDDQSANDGTDADSSEGSAPGFTAVTGLLAVVAARWSHSERGRTERQTAVHRLDTPIPAPESSMEIQIEPFGSDIWRVTGV
ncbi:MAG: hypothetical protein A07HR60_01306, partial [uncultured archaeon A07HR60]